MSKPKKAKELSIIFVKPYVFIRSLGDGSAAVEFFNTQTEADEYAKKYFEAHGERFCDDVCQVTLVIGPKTIKVCNVKKWKDE